MQAQATTSITRLQFRSMMYETVVASKQLREPLSTRETYNLSDLNVPLQVVHQRALHLKVMKMLKVVHWYCHQVLQHWNRLLTETHVQFRFFVMSFTQVVMTNYFFFLNAMQVQCSSMRCRSLGLNEITLKARRRRRNASNNRLWRTFPTDTRFGLTIGKPHITDKRFQSNIYSFTRVYTDSYLCLSQWFISRATRWYRDYSKLINNFHYRHGAAVGRLNNGDLFTIH